MPKVFEFHFNPKTKSDLIFDSFCYEPENIYEKRLGSLYLVGFLKNALPQDTKFLENLAKTIKERYYRLTLKNPEKALNESLREANSFLEQTAKRGDVRWLGNLSFAVLSLKNFEINFTKVGELKFYLLRGGKIIDIDRKLKFEEITPWPLRIFGNIVSGKLAENDVILISTKEVTDFLGKENLLLEMAKLEIFDQKKVSEIFNKRREEVLKISGILLVVVLTKEILVGKKEIISPKLYPKEFRLKEVFVPLVNFFKKNNPLQILKEKLKIKLLAIKLPKIPKLKLTKPKLKLNKNLILVLILIFLLFFGFLVAQKEERKKLEEYQNVLKEIQEKNNLAESFLILKETKPEAAKNANILFMECWNKISPLVKLSPNLPKNFANQIISLNEEISKNLYQLNNLISIEEPQIFFEFSFKDFIPLKMIAFQDELYFFNPTAENVFKIGKNLKPEVIEINQKFNLASELEDSVAFFSPPNSLAILSDKTWNTAKLKEPYPDSNFDDFYSFRENLYFLDKKAGQIIKYPYYGNFQWGEPELWLKKAASAKALTIDGSIWVLSKNNSIEKYDNGKLSEKIELIIFPQLKDLTKIFTSSTLPYLYILEPTQNRIIILNKRGEIIKQFQSKKFDNLLDFAVSQNGKTIYLLNGLKVYQINP